MLIKSFGEYWNPDHVNWGKRGKGNKGKLIGKVVNDKIVNGNPTRETVEVDFWEAKGIYVLYYEYEPIYVGKAFSTVLGKRLRDHLTDRLAGRWDMFSWFSISNVRFTQKDVSKPGKKYLLPETVNNTLEALAIMIIDPKLNRRRETLKDAKEAIQPNRPNPWTIRKYLEQILENTKK